VVRTLRIRIDDIEVSCSEAGAGDPPLVMLHGLTGHRDDFLECLPGLAARRRVLAPDLRGHGDATHVGGDGSYDFERLVRDLERLLQALDVPRCHLLGHSFGGMVALRFVLAHPERVASLVLMSTAPFAPDGYDRGTFEKAGAIAVARGMAFLQQLVEKAGRALANPAPSDLQVRRWSERYYAHMRKRYGAMDPVAYRWLGCAMVEQRSLVPRLGEIRCPATVLVGSDDEGFLEGADALEAGIAAARRITLEDAGHHPHIEATEAWTEAIEAHLARVAG